MRFWQSVRSQRSSESSQTGSSSDGQTPATAAQTSMRPSAVAGSVEEAVDLDLVGEVGGERSGAPPSSAATSRARSSPR